MSVAEQRYKAVQAVLAEGQTVMQVARDWRVSRQTIHGWLAKYEGDGLEGLGADPNRFAWTQRALGRGGQEFSGRHPDRLGIERYSGGPGSVLPIDG